MLTLSYTIMQATLVHYKDFLSSECLRKERYTSAVHQISCNQPASTFNAKLESVDLPAVLKSKRGILRVSGYDRTRAQDTIQFIRTHFNSELSEQFCWVTTRAGKYGEKTIIWLREASCIATDEDHSCARGATIHARSVKDRS